MQPRAPSVKAGENAGEQQSGGGPEPELLIKMRRNHEVAAGPLRVPNSLVVARGHFETVRPGRQASVVRLTNTTSLDPVVVEANESVLEPNARGIGQARRSEIKGQFA